MWKYIYMDKPKRDLSTSAHLIFVSVSLNVDHG